MSAEVTVRPSRDDDNRFVSDIFKEDRRGAFASAGLGNEQQDAILSMQFSARERGYSNDFTNLERSVIVIGETPVGCLSVARSPREITLVDIALLPSYRGRGIGTELILNLMAEGARSGRPVRLSVSRENRAIGLYLRLGFAAKAEEAGGAYLGMEWSGAGAARKVGDPS
jgi:ribosomal protein S18 acetylase RimI-like enzyme